MSDFTTKLTNVIFLKSYAILYLYPFLQFSISIFNWPLKFYNYILILNKNAQIDAHFSNIDIEMLPFCNKPRGSIKFVNILLIFSVIFHFKKKSFFKLLIVQSYRVLIARLFSVKNEQIALLSLIDSHSQTRLLNNLPFTSL